MKGTTYSKKSLDRMSKGLCLNCGIETLDKKVLCLTCMEKQVTFSRNNYLRLKIEVLNHYGNKCECCGEDNQNFLTIDHINQNKEGEICGAPFYLRLKNEGFPPEARILCYNCNFGRKEGECPHHNPDKNLRLSDLKYVRGLGYSDKPNNATRRESLRKKHEREEQRTILNP